MQNIADKVFIEKLCRLLSIMLLITSLMGFSIVASAQSKRSSVSVAEVTGTFRHGFSGRFKGSSSDIKIASAGRGKLHIAMELIYPYYAGKELMANLGELDGEAVIDGDMAVYKSTEFGQCQITIKFTRPGVIDVSQEGTDSDCGFGHNVTSIGRYVKVSSRKPRFDKK